MADQVEPRSFLGQPVGTVDASGAFEFRGRLALAPDAVVISDASISNGSLILNSPSGLWTPANVGQSVVVAGAGAAGVSLSGVTIRGFVSPKAVMLSAPASTTVSGAVAAYGTDNGPTLQAIWGLLAGTGYEHVIAPGQYLCATGMAVPSAGVRVSGYGAKLITALSGTQYDSFGVPFLAQPASTGAVVNLAANIIEGATTIQVSGSSIVAGNVIQLRQTTPDLFRGALYTVKKVSGSNPQTLTLDRSVLLSYTSGNAQVTVLNGIPTGTEIRGLSITGDAFRYGEFINCSGCKLIDVSIDDSVAAPRDIPWSWDTFSYGCVYERVKVTGQMTGLEIENNEASVFRDCQYIATPGVHVTGGYSLLDSVRCEVRNCTAYGYTGGAVSLSSDAGATGCVECSVIGGTFATSVGTDGIVINTGANNLIHDCVVQGCTSTGITVNSAVTGTRIAKCTVQNCGVGLLVRNSSDGTDVDGIVITGSTTNGMQLGGPTRMRGLVMTGGVTGLLINARVTLQGFKITQNVSGSIGITTPGGGAFADAVIRDGEIFLQNTGGGFNLGIYHQTAQAGSVFDISNVEITQSTLSGYTGVGIQNDVGTTVRIGDNVLVDSGSLTTPLNILGYSSKSVSGTTNAGLVTLNGTSAVSVAWPALKTTDRVLLTLHTRGSTPDTHAPLVTYTPGTGFTVTGSIASANDVYDYEVR